jgi:choline-glycine betaine transporter
LHYLFGIEQSSNVQVILIIFVSALASMSVFLGLDKGVKRLSELNLILALVFWPLYLLLVQVSICCKPPFKTWVRICRTYLA